MILRQSLWTLVLGIFAVGLPCRGIYSAKIGSLPTVWPASADEITVSAAISLKDALDEILHLYSSEHPSAEIHFNLGGSGTLQRQIEQGAPVDIFISASPKEMDSLQSQGLLVPDTRKDLVKNSVVLIVPVGSAGVSNFQDLTKPAIKTIAVGEPQTVPAGKYAQEVLMHLGIYDQLKPKLVFAKDVRQVLTYVETGNADAGIVYATETMVSKKVTVAATASEDSHSPVVYPAAIVRSSKNLAGAKMFIEFLGGGEARAVFQKYGFIPAGS
ncbi:MAG TPA: molybdate ABC transporter substrate-binding protein [Candidatus Acidoferrales bacterium]|nr:molybdate ABC transporter substrate-binding protein [Candidatus Acidoferrales bacterium]